MLKKLTLVLDAWTMMGMRAFLVTLMLLPVVVMEAKRRGSLPWKITLGPGIVFAFAQVLWCLAPYYNRPSVIMFVGRCAFFFSILIGFATLRSERWMARRPTFWLGSLVIGAGLLVMFLGTGDDEGGSQFGLILMIGTAIGWAIYNILVKRNLGEIPARLGFGMIVLWTLPIQTGLMFVNGDWQAVAGLTGQQWGLLLTASVISTGLGQICAYMAIHHFGPIVTEGAFNLVPFFSAIASFLILGDVMNGMQWTGGVGVLLGSTMLLVMFAKGRRPVEEEPGLP